MVLLLEDLTELSIYISSFLFKIIFSNTLIIKILLFQSFWINCHEIRIIFRHIKIHLFCKIFPHLEDQKQF